MGFIWNLARAVLQQKKVKLHRFSLFLMVIQGNLISQIWWYNNLLDLHCWLYLKLLDWYLFWILASVSLTYLLNIVGAMLSVNAIAMDLSSRFQREYSDKISMIDKLVGPRSLIFKFDHSKENIIHLQLTSKKLYMSVKFNLVLVFISVLSFWKNCIISWRASSYDNGISWGSIVHCLATVLNVEEFWILFEFLLRVRWILLTSYLDIGWCAVSIVDTKACLGYLSFKFMGLSCTIQPWWNQVW